MAEDITQDVAAFNFIVSTTSNESCGELKKRFRDTVEIYTDAKLYGRVTEQIKYDFKMKNVTLILQMRQGIQPNH